MMHKLMGGQYDYPSDITESVQDMSQTAASAWSSFANKNLKVSTCEFVPMSTSPSEIYRFRSGL